MITEIETFLNILKADQYDCRLVFADSATIDKPTIKKNLTEAEVKRHLKFWYVKNKGGYHVFIRPLSSQYVLLDDLKSRGQLEALKDYKPCLLVMTSPGNYQAWLKLPFIPEDRGEALAICLGMADILGADKGAAKPEQVGRLPGYLNNKPKYKEFFGEYPMVSLAKYADRTAEIEKGRFQCQGDSLAITKKAFAMETHTSSKSQSEVDWYLINRMIALGYSDLEIEREVKRQPGYSERKKSKNYLANSIAKARRNNKTNF